MTGISITVEFDAAETQARLRGLLARMERRQPFFEAIGQKLADAARARFRAEQGPDGTAWQPLRPATIKARERKGQVPITILRSNTPGKNASSLAGSINYQATGDEARIGSPVEYAAIHQLGGTIDKPERQGQIFRRKGKDGAIGRRFVKKKKANVVTEVAIGAHAITIPGRAPSLASRPRTRRVFSRPRNAG